MISEVTKTLIDFTLGDGHISRYIGPRKESSHFKLEHSIKQRDYLWHKAEILRSLGLDGIERVNTRVLNYKNELREYQTVSYTTKTHPEISTAYKWCYNSQRKAIDKHLLRELDVRSLAYWFMDDGSASSSNKATAIVNGRRYNYIYPVKKIGRYTLYTNGFTFDEVSLIQDWLKAEFGLTTLKNCTEGPVIRINSIEEKDRFRELIRPYIIPSLQYKIEGVHTWVGIDYTNVIKIDTERERLNEETPLGDDATV